MSNVNFLIEIGLAIHDVLVNLETIDKYHKEINNAKEGKRPFTYKETREMVSENSLLEKKIKNIYLVGIPRPALKEVSFSELSNIAQRQNTIGKLKEVMKTREDHLSKIKNLYGDIQKLEKEARAKSRLARELSQDFMKMARYAPPIGTTAFNAEFLTASQNFSKIMGSLNSVANSCPHALQKLDSEIKEYEFENKNMKTNLKTFSVL